MFKDSINQKHLNDIDRYLSLITSDEKRVLIMSQVQSAEIEQYPVKDILRAAGVEPKDEKSDDVQKIFKKISKGKDLRNIVVVTGSISGNVPLLILDGYSKLSALNAEDPKMIVPVVVVDINEVNDEQEN